MARERGTCTLDDCDRPHKARGLCGPHYKKWRRVNRPEQVRSEDRRDRERRKHLPEYIEDNRRRAREWREENPDRSRDAQLRAKYGIGVDQYNTILKQQHGVCALCRNPEEGRRLAVDHDPGTGRIRGLLCARCNLGIGYLRHDLTVFARAIAYLREWDLGEVA